MTAKVVTTTKVVINRQQQQTQIMFIVKAIAMVGGEEVHTFDNKQDALEKVRMFRDTGGFIVTIEERTTETVQQFKQLLKQRGDYG